MISVQDITKQFGPLKVLHGLSFDIARGEVLGLLGPNGAGKTTMIRILAGFFPPTEGRVTIDDVDFAKEPKKLKKRIGYMPERVSLYSDLKVEEFLHFVSEIKQIPRKMRKEEIQEKIERCGLETVRGRLIGHLSKGYRQRVGLAQALIGDPDILILDEPTSGLDPKQIIDIRELIRELGRERTLILSTHILPEASHLCERVLILNQGRIIAKGDPQDLEKKLRNQQEIVVRVGLRSVVDEDEEVRRLEEVLQSIPGVESLVKTTERDSTVTFLLYTVLHDDLRSEISRQIVGAGFPLLEISTKRLSLEDIFLKIVVSEKKGTESFV